MTERGASERVGVHFDGIKEASSGYPTGQQGGYNDRAPVAEHFTNVSTKDSTQGSEPPCKAVVLVHLVIAVSQGNTICILTIIVILEPAGAT